MVIKKASKIHVLKKTDFRKQFLRDLISNIKSRLLETMHSKEM